MSVDKKISYDSPKSGVIKDPTFTVYRKGGPVEDKPNLITLLTFQ